MGSCEKLLVFTSVSYLGRGGGGGGGGRLET